MQINKELLKNITLLYVEDDAMTLEEISYFLEKYVGKLIVAKNGEEGFELFKKHNPDMVISDIQMPVLNGLEMSRKILEINPEIPIALTSAYSDSDYLIEAIELGIEKYLLKPLNLTEILTLIQKSLRFDFNSKYYEEYIKFIIDSNNTFMFIVNSNKIEFVNKNLLKLLNENNIEILDDEFEKYKNLFELVDINTDKCFIDYIINNPNTEHLVTFKSHECLKLLNRKFYVKYKHFDSMNKSVFIFNEVDNSKLNEIKNISEDIINNHLRDKSDNILLENLNKIVRLTSKN